MTTRYSLFFADDVVQESIQTKSKVKYQLADGKDNEGNLDENFKIGLRQEGIYFDIDVTPNSPRKRNMFYAEQDENYENEGSNEAIPEEQIDSPTFKCLDQTP